MSALPKEDRAAWWRRPLIEALVVSAVVTAVVTTLAAALPDKHVATGVGLAFLGATWVLVFRHDDRTVRRFGLALGGAVVPLDPQPTGGQRAAMWRPLVQTIAWAGALALVTFGPFWAGWRLWWRPPMHFVLATTPWQAANEVLGQLVIIALPEEAFYRGYVQTRLDDAFPPRWRVLGATVGPGLFVTSAVFALGHLATIHDPTRLAVFFPSLVFGWLRARTGGIGAGVLFHASCNVFSEVLGRGYGVY